MPFDAGPLAYGKQVLWPDHCVEGSAGAELAPGLDVERAGLILRKGSHADVDSYSAFLEADRRTRTGLAGYLRDRGLNRLVLTGLATDFCILWTALDARAEGFAVLLVDDAVRGLDVDGSVDRALETMAKFGAERLHRLALDA